MVDLNELESLPMVSVVMATYNGEAYIKEQIISIINQSYKKIELIVQDDGSTDSTLDIIRSFNDKIKIRLEVNSDRIGFVKNFEKALSRAGGKYIALCDQDDVWHSKKIEMLVNSISGADLVHSNCQLIDHDGKIIQSIWKRDPLGEIKVEHLIFRNYITGCTVLLKSDLLVKALPFPNGLAYHDWWLAICAAIGNGIAYVDLPLVSYRQHDAQNTGSGPAKSGTKFQKILNIASVDQRKSTAIKQMENVKAASKVLLKTNTCKILQDAIGYHHLLIKPKILNIKLLMIGVRCAKFIRPYSKMPFLRFLISDFL